MKCLVCGRAEGKLDDHQCCDRCRAVPWATVIIALQLRHIAEALIDIEKKLPDKNKW